MIILNKKPITKDTVSVRMFGHDTTISFEQAKQYATQGKLYLKTNKAASLKDLQQLKEK